MLRAGGGRIVNVTSVVGHTGNAGQSPYTMAKAGLDAFTKSLALELAGRNILVNAVAPGFIDTAMTAELPEPIRADVLARVPLGRMGTPDEVAEVVSVPRDRRDLRARQRRCTSTEDSTVAELDAGRGAGGGAAPARPSASSTRSSSWTTTTSSPRTASRPTPTSIAGIFPAAR